jgi:hypothetical protein
MLSMLASHSPVQLACHRPRWSKINAPPERSTLRVEDTKACVYHQPGIDLLHRVVGTDNILFAPEMLGAARSAAITVRTPSTASCSRRVPAI